MNYLITVVMVLLAVMASGCSRIAKSDRNSEEQRASVDIPSPIRVIFFDFRGQRVFFSANNDVLVDETLQVTVPETGFSKEVSFAHRGHVDVILRIDDIYHSRELNIGPSDRIVYVSPFLPGKIDVSDNSAVLLD